jgi:hypothetical protein
MLYTINYFYKLLVIIFYNEKRKENEDPLQVLLRRLFDTLPSPRVNPLEGSPKCSCGKLGLERRSRLPAL